MTPCRKSQGEKSVHNFGANQCDLVRYCHYCPQNQESKHGSSVDYLQLLELFSRNVAVHVFIGVCDFHRQNNPRIIKYQIFQYYSLYLIAVCHFVSLAIDDIHATESFYSTFFLAKLVSFVISHLGKSFIS